MKRLLLSTAIIAALSACGNNESSTEPSLQNENSATSAIADTVITDENFVATLDEMFMTFVNRSPEFQSYLGIKDNQDKWDDISDESEAEDHALNQELLARLKQIDINSLNADNQLTLRMVIAQTERSIEGYQWRHHTYLATQMRGRHASVPSTLINVHRITDVADAEAYISRLKGIQPLFAQLEERLTHQQSLGIMPPKFAFEMVISDSRNIITGAPFDNGEDSTLFEDFKNKVSALEISEEDREALIASASEALTNYVKPAYESLITLFEAHQSIATTDDGAWKLPNGADYYSRQLEIMTTTDLSAEEIHQIGLDEVARIHSEMRDIMEVVGYEGTLQEFFAFMRTDPQFYYSNDDEGKAAYLAEATRLIDVMREQLDDYFGIKPQADMIVKAVEPYREKSAGKAFYNSPALDGSRPGIYYANLYNMADMPIYQMEALAYHEGIPGHHMQLAIAQELGELPLFRRFGRYTAYSEGWGLYSEYLPKEMGYYEDPYSDFGRLAMELWRACRLVVDTGLHHKQWSREEAIDYLAENTPNPQGDVVKAIERYIVMPGQATAYKIGMLKILELREDARATLGDQFSIREFHDIVLGNGPVPLDILEENVDAWVASKQ